MIKNGRQEKLLRILSKENSMKITDLSQQLNSSTMTIRRDLDTLEKNGIVKRFHGGVTLMKTDANQPSFYERIREFDREKDIIGQEAAKLIAQGSIVFFDAGTTPLATVAHIPDDLEFTAITTGLLTAVALCNKPKINVISIGGDIHHSSYSSVNYMAVDIIRNFHADMALISTKSLQIPEGIYEAQLPLLEIKQSIVSVSDRIVLMADNSKFDNKSMCKAVAMEDIHLLITDHKTKAEHIDRLRAMGKEVIVAHED